MAQAKKREILFVWNYVEWGGVQIYLLGIMRLAKTQGYPVKAVMPEDSSEKLLGYLERENIPTAFFPARVDLSAAPSVWGKIRRRLRDARCAWVTGRYLAKQGLSDKIVQIDVGVWSSFWLLFFLARRTHVFITMHIATPYNPRSWRDRLTKIKYRLLSGLNTFHMLASNEDMKNSLRPFLPAEFWERIPLAYTGVNTTEMREASADILDREELLSRYQLPGDKLLVISLANIIERKGFRVWLDAARLLIQTRQDLHFVWIGDGEKREEMLDLIRQTNLTQFVTVITPSAFGGERKKLLQLLRLADIFVHPSFAEGLPGAMLEAMALGKPVVVSRVNAIPECVVNGENGFLIAAGDSAGFAQAVARLADDRDLRDVFGGNARQRVLDNFTEERCAEITLDYYEKCLRQDNRIAAFDEVAGNYADEKS